MFPAYCSSLFRLLQPEIFLCEFTGSFSDKKGSYRHQKAFKSPLHTYNATPSNKVSCFACLWPWKCFFFFLLWVFVCVFEGNAAFASEILTVWSVSEYVNTGCFCKDSNPFWDEFCVTFVLCYSASLTIFFPLNLNLSDLHWQDNMNVFFCLFANLYASPMSFSLVSLQKKQCIGSFAVLTFKLFFAIYYWSQSSVWELDWEKPLAQ